MRNEDRSPLPWLHDIVAWSERLLGYVDGLDEEAFLRTPIVQDTVSRCATIVGEAANNLRRAMPDVEQRFPSLELGYAYAMRNRLVQGYGGVDYRILWRTAQSSIPPLLDQARAVLAELEGSAAS